MSSNARTSHSGNSFFDPPIENYRFYAQKISRKDGKYSSERGISIPETRQTGMFLKQFKKANHGSGLMQDKLGSSGSVYYQRDDSNSDLPYRLSNSQVDDFDRRDSDNMTNDKYSSSLKNSTLVDPREITD